MAGREGLSSVVETSTFLIRLRFELREEVAHLREEVTKRIDDMSGEVTLCKTAIAGGAVVKESSHTKRRKHGDIQNGLCTIHSWEAFKGQLKKKFCPHNAEDVAMRKLRGLKHTGSIKDYVAEFTTLMLELPDLQEKDKLFYFSDEDLLDYRRDTTVRKKTGGDKPAPKPQVQDEKFQVKPSTSKGKAHEGGPRKERKELKCFLCDGPHMIRDCPKKKSFNSLVLEEEQKETKVRSMRILNSLAKNEAVTSKENKEKGGGLMFVEAKVNGGNTKALVDTGASHNFMAEQEALKLGIKYTKESGWIKAVNASSQPILGVACEVPIQLA
ncbi:hypothetical protein LIER_07136 [Lithospermum erythrorhizon]|uniref:Retrotransposon gag domain-containing protein n=1 Tax=Lithospermum erythrorhizon TaxID=34254 RepID=A0AAV3P8I2_LITER